MRLKSDNSRLMRLYIKSVFEKQGKNMNICELCGKQTERTVLHHTKYDNANIKDIKIICYSCNLKKENVNLK